MCLKDTLEQLALKYRECKSAHNRKITQDLRIKLLKEESFHEEERILKKLTTTPNEIMSVPTGSTSPLVSPAASDKKELNVSEKEKKSMEDEGVLLQKLINSELEVIKQTQNKMVEISMLIRQFSVKAFEQKELTEISNFPYKTIPNSIKGCGKFSKKYTKCK